MVYHVNLCFNFQFLNNAIARVDFFINQTWEIEVLYNQNFKSCIICETLCKHQFSYAVEICYLQIACKMGNN